MNVPNVVEQALYFLERQFACSKKCCFNHVLLHLLLFVVT